MKQEDNLSLHARARLLNAGLSDVIREWLEKRDMYVERIEIQEVIIDPEGETGVKQCSIGAQFQVRN